MWRGAALSGLVALVLVSQCDVVATAQCHEPDCSKAKFNYDGSSCLGGQDRVVWVGRIELSGWVGSSCLGGQDRVVWVGRIELSGWVESHFFFALQLYGKLKATITSCDSSKVQLKCIMWKHLYSWGQNQWLTKMLNMLLLTGIRGNLWVKISFCLPSF